jgi:hypothetical protein
MASAVRESLRSAVAAIPPALILSFLAKLVHSTPVEPRRQLSVCSIRFLPVTPAARPPRGARCPRLPTLPKPVSHQNCSTTGAGPVAADRPATRAILYPIRAGACTNATRHAGPRAACRAASARAPECRTTRASA